jgi:hypothetical protein
VQDEQFDAAVKFYEDNFGGILEVYEGQFVAILDNGIIDHDTDRLRLLERVYRELGYRAVFVPFVAPPPVPIRRASGPRKAAG